jgi:hypothetical protein
MRVRPRPLARLHAIPSRASANGRTHEALLGAPGSPESGLTRGVAEFLSM